MICNKCREQLENPKQPDTDHWRCLTKTIWSTLPAAQVVAIRQLETLSNQLPWAAELLEQAYITPEIKEWSNNT